MTTPHHLTEIKNKIKGPVFPIPTPFTHDEKIDWHALENYIQFLIKNGARIIHVMVHTSRFPLLTENEMQEVNAFVTKTVKAIDPDCLVIVADPWMCSTRTSIEFAQKAHEAGADVIGLIYGERCYKEKNVMDHFHHISQAIPDIGLLLHEQDLFTIHGTKLMPYSNELLLDLISLPNMIAMKEDSKNDAVTRRILETVKDDISIIVSGGSKEQFIKFYQDGMHAWLVGVGSFDPKVALDFYEHLKNNDEENAWHIINKLERPFFDVSKRIGWHIGLKSAMMHLNLMNAVERKPLKECTTQEHEEIREILKQCGWTTKDRKRIA